MNFTQLAMNIADIITTNNVGTRAIVWSDGTVTRTQSCLNPILSPGSTNRPIAFFVAGIDRPDESAIAERLRRAWNSVMAA